ncbi:MAG: sulfotransferase [Acidobacteria bacterium]|nr:sulfotransferase [Acidobacteriota bacterium]
MNGLLRLQRRVARALRAFPGAAAPPSKIQFFVVGTGRCGSTLLRDLLNLHPEIFAPAAESHWIPLQYEVCGCRPNPLALYTDVVERVFYDTGELTVDVMAAGVGTSRRQLFAAAGASLAQDAPTIVEWNDALYGALAAATGRSLLGDKTPCYCLHMPLIQGLWPDAKFIHLIRDGRDAALSMSKHPGFRIMASLGSASWPPLALDRRYGAASESDREPALQDFIGLWAHRLRRALDDSRRLRPGSYREVRYEDLLRDPGAEMARLAEFLGVASPREWLAQVQRVVRPGNAGRVGDRAAWEALTAAGRETLAAAGYPV